MNMRDIMRKLDILSNFPKLDEAKKAAKKTAKKPVKKSDKKDEKKKPSTGKSEWMVKGVVDGRTKVITVSAGSESEARDNATNRSGFKVVSVRKKGVATDAADLDEGKDYDDDDAYDKNDPKSKGYADRKFDSADEKRKSDKENDKKDKSKLKEGMEPVRRVHRGNYGDGSLKLTPGVGPGHTKASDLDLDRTTARRGNVKSASPYGSQFDTEFSVNSPELDEGKMKDIEINFFDLLDNGGVISDWALNDGDNKRVEMEVQQALDNSTEFSHLDSEMKDQLHAAGMKHLGFDFDDHYDVMDPPEDGEGMEPDQGAFDYDQEVDETVGVMAKHDDSGLVRYPKNYTGPEGQNYAQQHRNKTAAAVKAARATNALQGDTGNKWARKSGEYKGPELRQYDRSAVDEGAFDGDYDPDSLNEVRRLAGLKEAKVEVNVVKKGTYSNEPKPVVQSTEEAITDRPSDDLHKKKSQHADKPKLGDNPLATKCEDKKVKESKLWKEYEQLKSGVIVIGR